MQASTLDGGFADPPKDAARAFRAIMDVIARPGDIRQVAGATPPAPLSSAAGTLMLALCDPDTPIYLAPSCATAEVKSWMRFHTGAPLAAPAAAMFLFGAWDELRDLPVALGTPEYPDRSATLVVELHRLEPEGARLRGPGIRLSAALSLPGTEAFRCNNQRFPLGFDCFFACNGRLAALPRSTEVG
ncbi:MAG: phosphonate C-P lyase system protein PhnH [Pseudomonadota bacterium]